jgi:hypothetical protein
MGRFNLSPRDTQTKLRKNKMTGQNGRQRFARLEVRWTVQIFESSERPAISSETDNVSSDGFYFRARERFSPGEELECLILIPTFDPSITNNSLDLRCRVRVMAVEVLDDSKGFGVECHIENYSFSAIAKQNVPCGGDVAYG